MDTVLRNIFLSNMLLFFDFDGTIADSLSIAEEVIAELGAEFGLPPADKAQLLEWKTKSIPDLLRLTGISWTQIPQIMIKAKAAFNEKIEFVPLFEGMKTLMESLHEKGHELHILTSNSKQNVQHILDKNVLTVFHAIHAPNVLFGKAKVIRSVMKKRKQTPENTWMIGDEIRDIQAAKEAGVKSVAVSWGFNHESLLVQANPDFLVHTPEALRLCFLDIC